VKISLNDALTGLPGRFLLDEIKGEFIRRETSRPWTCIMIDVDHFKLINDIYGHLSGDRILVEVSGILQKQLQMSGTLLRFGGDEFLVVLKNTPVKEALKLLESVMDDIRKMNLLANLNPSLSIGMAESYPDDSNILAVVDRADKALYDAKAMGRGRIVSYSEKEQMIKTSAIRLNQFVGRRVELNALRQLLEESVTDGSRFALLEGDPGIGKSRLAAEMIQYAHFRNCVVMRAECFEFGDIEPYTFFLKPIRDYLRNLQPDDMHALKRMVEPVHPATSELFPGLELCVSPDLQFFREERLKFRIFEDFSKIFTAVSKQNPILFIVDDIQWMTSPDLELYKFLVRSSGKNHVMFIVTMRNMEKSSDDIRVHLQTLNRIIPFLTLKLNNLEKQETYNLVMFALKDPNMPQQVLETIYRQSGGNPFFLEELINSMIQTGVISQNPSGDWSYFISRNINLPDSLAQLIAARLFPLNTTSRNYLRIAALSTGNFSVDMIAAVTGNSSVEVMEGLEEPVRLNLVQCDAGHNRTIYRFVHDMICSFLHREMSEAMKKSYHKRIAEHLEKHYLNESAEEYIIDMAYHYSESDCREKTIWSSLLAANVLEKRQAFRDMARWLEIYFQNCDATDLNLPDRFRTARKLGVLYTMFGDYKNAMRYLDSAETMAQEKDNVSSVKLRRGHLFQNVSMYCEARECYESAFAFAVSGLKKIDALNALAFLDYMAGDLKKALMYIHQAEKVLDEVDIDQGTRENYIATLATTKGIIACALIPGPEAVAEYEKALDIYLKYEDCLGQAVIYINLSDVFSRTGHYEKALDSLRKAESISSRLGDVLNVAISLYNTAILYLEINQPILAREFFQRYTDINMEINNEVGLAYSNLGTGELFEEEGDVERAGIAYRKAIEVFERLGIENMALAGRLALAHLLIRCNKINDADTVFKTGMKVSHEILEKDLKSDILFIEGLLKLKQNAPDNMDTLSEAENLIGRSLEEEGFSDVSVIMRSYYYLIDIKRRQKQDDQADSLLRKARSEFRKRLEHIEKPHIRESISKKSYIRDIMKGV
jgi:diguanylate cyclase (GGDEF)-like protein